MNSSFLPRRRLLVLAALAPLATLPRLVSANPGAANLKSGLAAIVDDPRWPLAGLSVLTQQGGRTFSAQYGRRHINADRPITPDTLFRVASISKLITGLGALRLAEAGKLDLDADIGDVLGYSLRNPHFVHEPIRVHHLMSHQSSLRDAGGIAFPAGTTLQSVLTAADSKSWASETKPGEYFSYCNLNYGLLASVMERAAGQRFDRLMQAWVLQPMGMAGGFDAMVFSADQQAQIATLYRHQIIKDGKEIWDAAGPWTAQTDDLDAEPLAPIAGLDDHYKPGDNGTLFGPQGRLRTRVSDLGRVASMLLADGAMDGQRFLAKASVERMFTEQWRHEPAKENGDTFDGLFQSWGMGAQHFIDRSSPGWGDRLAPGVQAWGHLGFAYGLEAAVMLDRRTRRSVVYVLNGHSADPATHRGHDSSFPVWQERINRLLWTS